jgi:hypothetical protein
MSYLYISSQFGNIYMYFLRFLTTIFIVRNPLLRRLYLQKKEKMSASSQLVTRQGKGAISYNGVR